MTWLGLTPDEWAALSAIGTMAAAVAAATTVIVTGFHVRGGLKAGRQQLALDKANAEAQLDASRKAAELQLEQADRAARSQLEQHREAMAAQEQQSARVLLERTRPYVVVSFESSVADASLIDLVIRNIGTTPAYRIRFSSDTPMTQSDDRSLAETRMFTDGMRMLAPGAEIRVAFDSMLERCPAGLDMHYVVSVDYANSQGDEWVESFDLDLDDLHDLSFFVTYNLHHAAVALREINKTVKGWTALKTGRVEAVVEDREASRERRERETQERNRERERLQRIHDELQEGERES